MLWMVIIGFFGVALLFGPAYDFKFCDMSRWVQIIGVVWAAIWLGPPLVKLWISGVLG